MTESSPRGDPIMYMLCVHILHQECTLDVINLIIIIIKIMIQFKNLLVELSIVFLSSTFPV